MNDHIKNINLMQRLIERLNSEVFEMSYTLIANYLLRNLSNMQTITIEKVCQEAFVSKSTIRRFCNNIGYHNFSELKQAYLEIENNFYDMNYVDSPLEIPKILNDVYAIETNVIESITSKIYNEYIFILFPYELYAPFYEFQREMLLSGKVIHLMPNIDLHYKDTKHYMDHAVLMIAAFNEDYHQNIMPYLNELNSDNIYLSDCEKQSNQNNHYLTFKPVKHPAFRKYQLMFFLDRVIASYRELENV